MEQARLGQRSPPPRGPLAFCAAGALCLLLASCGAEPLPRTFSDFMDDAIARDGTLARCNDNPDSASRDLECANARRAAATIALRQERARREVLELESARKIEELKQEMIARERIARDAALAAARAEREAYEALWRERGGPPGPPYGPVQAEPEPPRNSLGLIEISPDPGAN